MVCFVTYLSGNRKQVTHAGAKHVYSGVLFCSVVSSVWKLESVDS